MEKKTLSLEIDGFNQDCVITHDYNFVLDKDKRVVMTDDGSTKTKGRVRNIVLYLNESRSPNLVRSINISTQAIKELYKTICEIESQEKLIKQE